MRIIASITPNKWTDFEYKEWEESDREYYGRAHNWDEVPYQISALNGNTLIGVLRMEILVGVVFIDSLIVTKNERHKGIGRKLMLEAEKIAQQNKSHKIYLETGKTWPTVPLYESLGYKVTADLPNHYDHVDFVEMTKFL